MRKHTQQRVPIRRAAAPARCRIAPIFALATLLAFLPALHAADTDDAGGATAETPVREIFVPFEDLHVLLQQQPRRVLLSRAEYEALREKAKTSPETRAPAAVVLVSADYTATIEAQRTQLAGTLVVDVLEDGLHAVPLDLGGVGLRGATLDGQGAAIGRSAEGRLELFVEGRGRHELMLEMVAPLETTAARQVLHFRLPRPPAAHLRLTVPGDVEVKSGADVISRVVDAEAEVTRFELLPPQGDTTLVMSLNSRLQRRQRAVVARSVLVDEVTEAYEKLHATISLGILHRAVDHFQFVVPAGFEITRIDAPLLARWDVEEDGGRRLLNVRLREQTTETVVLNVSAIKTPGPSQQWSFPRFEALDVVGQATVVGLLVQQRLNAESIVAEKLIRIDTAVLNQALPESLLQVEPGTPPLRAVVAYYAPQSEFNLRADFDKPPAKMAVRTSLLLTLAEKGHEVLGGLAMLPKAEKRFAFDLAVPPRWHVTSVTAADEKPLAFERHQTPDGVARIRVRVPEGMPIGQEFSVNFHANHTPPGWLGDWQQRQVEFPVFSVVGAADDVGAIAVEVRDDMTVRPDGEPQQLTPLDEAEKQRYGLSDVVTNLAYRYENPQYGATLLVQRTRPRLTARTFSFLRVEPGALAAGYEVHFNVDEARTRRLSLRLPAETTPQSLTMRGLDGVKLKQYDSEPAEEGMRRWNVQLAEARRGTVRLAVDFQQPLPDKEHQDLPLPIVSAEGVAYQSGVVAVEGSAELNVQVQDHPRRVDVGELADAEYQPGRRLLGAYGFVGDPAKVTVNVSRDPSYSLPAAIVQRAELSTWLSPEGISQTQASLSLCTKAPYLELVLPPRSEVWSVFIDRTAVKPQLRDQSLLVSLPPAADNALRELRVVYATPLDVSALSGKLTVPAPRLLLQPDAETPVAEVPLADLVWRLYVPSGYRMARSGGSVVLQQQQRPELAAITVAKGLYVLAGGVDLFGGGLIGTLRSGAREAAIGEQTMPSPYYLADDVQYFRHSGEEPAAEEGRPATVTVTALEGAEAERADPFGMPTEETPSDEPVMEIDMPEAPAAEPDVNGPAVRIVTGAGELVGEPPGEGPAPLQPPTAEPPPTHATPAPDKPAPGRDDLKGVRSLEIDLNQGPQDPGGVVVFRSLGIEPQLEITLGNRHRNTMLTWGLALALGLGGLAITNRTARTKLRYVLIAALATTGVSLVVDNPETVHTSNVLFYTATLLIPYYLLAATAKWLARQVLRVLSHFGVVPAAATATLLAALALPTLEAYAAEPAASKDGPGPYVIQIVDPSQPVDVPEDAVILPYDPASETGIADADKLLLPYAEYVELWNRAYPDEKIETAEAPARYALAGASYTTMLTGNEYLLITGQLQIDVYADGYVEVPLGLQGGVLARAELDGKPARLSVATLAAGANAPNAPPSQPAPQQAKQRPQAPPKQADRQVTAKDGSVVVLYVSGKGRHRLELAVRLRLARQGGWRVAQGVLPSASATALTLTVPEAQTELRLSEVADRTSYETQQADEKIDTALGGDGAVSIQWRPQVAEGQVDRSLTAQSTAVLDVQEDGLRLVWELQLKFPRSEREQFGVDVPEDYLVEKVEGTNVRGWEVRQAEGRQTVDVTLLKAAKEQELVTLHLWRRGAVGQGADDEIGVPAVSVPDAALHNGQITIRRSPLLDLRTLQRTGVTRTDLDQRAAELAGGADSEESPLHIQPYQAYRFVTTPFSIRLQVAQLAAKVTAEVQTVLKVAEYERSLDSRITFSAQGRPLHRLEMLLPGDLKLKSVLAPGEFQWALTDAEQTGLRLLSIYLGSGQLGEASVLLQGTLGETGPIDELPLPQIEIRNVQRQQGDIAVQVDPGFRVETADLQNCQRVDLLRQRYGWLDPGQRKMARLGVHYRQPDYRGTLKLEARTPVVTCSTFTNVYVTDRTVEETILLDFAVRDAGIQELAFRLPAQMKGCRIKARMLRQKTIETDNQGDLLVKLELQDEVMDQLRVVVENDRLLKAGRDFAAPVPVVETGRTDRRFVILQSASRDEVVVDKRQRMKPLTRQQEEWRTLQEILGGHMTQAYLVTSGAGEPSLTFRTKDRQTVEMAGARIGFARTVLVLDAHGAYRAEVTYRLDNTTEQFLEIELPQGAALWTARVAGEPVKPAKDPQATGLRQVRIPLVKTAPGDLDYEVALKYGGKMSALGRYGTVDFPLVHTRNINVEMSQVRLFVPKTHRWFDFGGTMRLVTEEADLAAGILAYQTKQAQRLIQTYQTSGDFAKVRVLNNAKQIMLDIEDLSSSQEFANPNDALRNELANNAEVLAEVEKLEQLDQLQQPTDQVDSWDNRSRLNSLFEKQKTTRSRNVVQDLGGNWTGKVEQLTASPDGKMVFFNGRWLDKNQLDNPAVTEKGGKEATDESTVAGKPRSWSYGYALGKKPAPQAQSQPGVPQFAQGQRRAELIGRQQAEAQEGQRQGDKTRDALIRYQQRLQTQDQQWGGQQAGSEVPRSGQRGSGRAAGDRFGLDSQGESVPGGGQNGGQGAQPGAAPAAPAAVPAGIAGLASLDVELPECDDFYQTFNFTTPRGEVRITARSASQDLLNRLADLAVVAAILAAAAYLVRVARNGRLVWLTQSGGSTLLICLGALAFLFGVLPIAGMIALVAGVAFKLFRIFSRFRTPSQPMAVEG